MGKRYTKQEINQIQALTTEGHTIKEIADMLGRPEAGIRNIRHRMKLKTKKHQSLETLRQDEKTLTRRVSLLRQNIRTLETRRQTVQQALNIEEQALNTKLQQALHTMKDEKPELFRITMEEQLGKIAIELTGSFLKYLIG